MIIVLILFFSFFPTHNLFALTNSEPADGSQYEANVFIQSSAMDRNTGDSSLAFCNGTLLSSKLLITAAHCIADAKILNSKQIQIEVGRYVYAKRKTDGQLVRIGYGRFLVKATTGTFYFSSKVLRKIQQSGFQTQFNPDEDFGVILLDQPLELPKEFIFAKNISQNEFLQLNEFRDGKDFAVLSDLLNMKVVSINPFVNVNTTNTKRFSTLNSLQWSKGFYQSTSNSRVEEGDSGAPLFAQTNSGLVVLGVVKGRGQSSFGGNWDAFASSAVSACEIASDIKNPEDSKALCH